VEITEVRIKLMEEPGERLKAFCSITFDDSFVVRDLKIIEGTNGPFVAMPSRKLTSHCPNCGCKNHLRAAHCNQCGIRMRQESSVKDEDGRVKLYADIAHPINSTCREMIQQRVIEAFSEEMGMSAQPDYVSTYDDFDHAPVESAPVESASAARPSAPPAPAAAPPEEEVQPAATSSQPQIQPAEKPRGPHKASDARTEPSRSGDDSFGAGVF